MAYVVLCSGRLARLRAERRSLPECTTAKRVERLEWNKEEAKQFLAKLLQNNYQILQWVNSRYLALQDYNVMLPLFQRNKCFSRKL